MNTITLRVDEGFFETVNTMTQELHTTKTALIKEAVLSYRRQLEEKKLRAQLINASKKVRRAAAEEAKIWDECAGDGLDDV